MNDIAVLHALAGRRPAGSVVYSLVRNKRRSFIREMLDIFVSGGALGGVADVADTLNTANYLIATETKGIIVALRNGRISSSFDIPDWRPEWKENFKKVTLDDYGYRKVARIDG